MSGLFDPFSKPGHLIRRLQQIAVLTFHESMAEHDLTPTQYVSLQVVESRPGIDQITLSELTAIDRSMNARIVEILARRGLLEKIPGKIDRRVNALFITDAAAKLLRVVEAQADQSQDKIVAALTSAERVAFLGMVRKIIADYEQRSDGSRAAAMTTNDATLRGEEPSR